MVIYSVVMFFVSLIVVGIGIAIYNGRTDFIHDYHQTNVTDHGAYGKAFGKALFVVAGALLLSGIIGLVETLALVAVAVLLMGLSIGILCLVAVQKKYNGGVF